MDQGCKEGNHLAAVAWRLALRIDSVILKQKPEVLDRNPVLR